jgi:hypothetical protein
MSKEPFSTVSLIPKPISLTKTFLTINHNNFLPSSSSDGNNCLYPPLDRHITASQRHLCIIIIRGMHLRPKNGFQHRIRLQTRPPSLLPHLVARASQKSYLGSRSLKLCLRFKLSSLTLSSLPHTNSTPHSQRRNVAGRTLVQ